MNNKEILKVIERIKSNHNIIFLRRDKDSGKNPYDFFLEIGINADDAINIVKSLTIADYKYTLLDSKNKFTYMYVFIKKIKERNVYIKIGFKIESQTIVISFHEAQKEE